MVQRRCARARRAAWDWSFFEDGALALERHELWTDVEPPPRLRLLQAKVPHDLNELASSVTVPRMPRRRTATRRRPTRAQRQARGVAACAGSRRREHRLRRFALLSLVAFVARRHARADRVRRLVRAARRRRSRRRPRSGCSPRRARSRIVIAKLGDLRLQLPISPSRVTAIGFHARRRRRARAAAGRTAGERGTARAARPQALRRRRPRAGLVPDRRRPGPAHERRSTSARAPGTAVYSPVDGRVVGVDAVRHRRPHVRRAHRHPAGAALRRSSSRSRTSRRSTSLSVGATVTASQTPLANGDRPERRRAAVARAVHERRGQPRRARGPARGDAALSASCSILFLADIVGTPGTQGGRGAPAVAARGARRRLLHRERRERRGRRRHHAEARRPAARGRRRRDHARQPHLAPDARSSRTSPAPTASRGPRTSRRPRPARGSPSSPRATARASP